MSAADLQRDGRRATTVAVLFLVAATLATYGNSLGADFVWDDVPIVVESALGTSPPGLAEVLLSPDEVKPYYRPLSRASYLVDARIWGRRPWAFHGVNLALHAANVVALFFLVRLLFRDRRLALGAALLLAVHPLNAETVDFVSARNNLFALLFLQGAIGLLASGLAERSRATIWASGLSWFLALSSKESAAAGAALLAAYAALPILPTSAAPRHRALALLPHALFLGAYLSLRAIALEGLVGTPLQLGSVAETLRLNYHAMPRYLELVLFPARLNVFHELPAGGVMASPWLLVAWAASAAGVVLLVRQRSLPSLAGLAWFAVNYLPAANLVPIPSAAMAERFLYLPAVGLWLIAADQAIRLWERGGRKRWVAALMALAVVGLASRTVRRNADWRDDVALFESSLAVNPRSVIASFNLGSALRDRGDLAGAEGAWRRALEIDPGEAGSTIQLGTLAAVRGDMGEAERLYRSAQEREPGNALLQLNLARLLERTSRPREALVHYDRFLELATKDHAGYVRGARESRERILRQLGDTR